jgi:hypothetical protein
MKGKKKHIAYTEFQATLFSLDFAAIFNASRQDVFKATSCDLKCLLLSCCYKRVFLYWRGSRFVTRTGGAAERYPCLKFCNLEYRSKNMLFGNGWLKADTR